MEEQEKEYEWHKVMASSRGSSSFVKPGKIRSAMVRDDKLCFAEKNGKTHAFSSKCPHNGFALENARLNDAGDIVCPLHRYSFCVETGENTSGEGLYLPHFPVEFREDGMYVGFERPERKKKKGWFW